MKYKINIVSHGVAVDRVTVGQARRTSLFTALTAFIIAAIGVAYIYFNRETESSIPFIAAGFGGLLAMVFLLHAMLAGRLLRPLPEQVLFNNERALVEVRHHASGVKKIEIRYSQIHAIDSRMVSHWDSNSKKYNHRYAVTLYLKDGSSWDLMEDSIMDLSYATDYVEKIKSNTTFGKVSSDKVVLPKLDTPRLSIVHRGDETQIRWRNNNPANMARRLAIPIVVIIMASFMSLMAEGDEWSALGDALEANVNSFSDLAKIPGLMGGLVITAGIVLICLIVLLVQMVRIIRYRLTENYLTVNKSLVTSAGSDLSIPLPSAGSACMTYHIGKASRTVEILRQAPSLNQTESTTFEGDLNFKTAMGMMGKSIKEGLKEALEETFTSKNDGEPNALAEFSFDRYSPLDVYTVKESIRQKLKD